MNKKTLETLEFYKILERLAEFAVTDIAKSAAMHLEVSDNIKRVNHMQDETAQACNLITKKGTPPIHCTADVRPALKRAERQGTLSLGELYSIAKILKTTRAFKSYPDDVVSEALDEHFEALYEDKRLEMRIFDIVIDAETIADNASPELSDIRRKIKNSNNKVKDILHSMITSQAYAKCLQEQIVTMRGDRYVIPVKSEYRGEIKGILHDTSSTGATLFIEPMQVVDANNEIRDLMAKEKDEIERILSELTSEVADVSKLIQMSFDILTELDLIFARAKFSLKYDAYRPVLNDNGYVNLERARHPLLDPATVVPTDIRLGRDFDTLVITGPNTGGKTVVLKTLGLLTLMAQAGLHIPAREGSVVSVFRNIFADIGDEQSIEQSLSTFSAHMVNIVKILGEVDDSSLCLFDELGAGTDPIEGASLAVSILERVRGMGAKSAATTHYSELKMYALSTDGVENASCEFDVDTLRPTYKLLIGIPGKSNAFAISKKLGLDESIIEYAKNHIAAENVKFEDILSELERTRAEMQAEKDKAKAYKKDTEKLRADTANTNRLLRDKTDRIIERARMEAKQILDDAREEADELIKQIREIQKQADFKEAAEAAIKARQKLNEKAKKNSEKLADSMFKTDVSYKPPKTVKPGDDVEIVKMGQKGVVVTTPDDKGDIMVKVGIMKIKTNLSDIRLVAPPKESNTGKQRRNFSSGDISKTMSLSPELDVRGETVDTACMMVDKFLSDAIISSLGQVRIVHGKGTGMLRQGIHRYLKTLSYVKSYRIGVFGEGDSGVTIVELK